MMEWYVRFVYLPKNTKIPYFFINFVFIFASKMQKKKSCLKAI